MGKGWSGPSTNAGAPIFLMSLKFLYCDHKYNWKHLVPQIVLPFLSSAGKRDISRPVLRQHLLILTLNPFLFPMTNSESTTLMDVS